MRKDLDHGLLHAMSAFVNVVDAGSFTAAAEQMSLTKAQVSRLVTKLENRLQTKLLQRTTRHIALTDVGGRYVGQRRMRAFRVRIIAREVQRIASLPDIVDHFSVALNSDVLDQVTRY